MDEEAHITDTGSTEATPVETTSEPSASTEDKISAEMEQTFNAIEARERGQRSPDTQIPTDATAVPETLSPPNSIGSRAGPEIWAATPKEMQQLILDRELEAQTKISEQGNEIAELKRAGGHSAELASVVDHFKPGLSPQFAALQPVDQIARLYRVAELLERDPIGSLKQLADHYRVNLGQIGGNQDGGQQAQQLQHQLAQMQHQFGHWQNQREQFLTQEIQRFAEGKKYWGELEGEIEAQIKLLGSQNPGRMMMDPMSILREAEQRALNVRSDVRDKLPERVAEMKKKVDEAKRLAALNVKSTTGASPRAARTDMYSEMRDVYERLHPG
jgi:hypothetical protein